MSVKENTGKKIMNTKHPRRILLAHLPYWDPLIPPMGIAALKRFLQPHGFHVKTIDLNVEQEFKEIYDKYFDALKTCVPENKRGNFYNIGHDILQNHMMACFNYQDEEAYRELIKILIHRSYYVSVDTEAVCQLNRIMDDFYTKLKEYFIGVIEEEKPGVLGLTAYKATLPACLFIFKVIKERYPHIKTILGGGVFADSHAIGSPNFEVLLEKTKPYLDKIIIGQGEYLFLKYLLDELPGARRVYTGQDIDGGFLDFSAVEIPDFADFDLQRYPYLAATASCGCIHRCSFCNSVKFWGEYRKKNIQQTVEEMIRMYETYGHQLFFMTDSLLNPVATDMANEFLKAAISLYYDAYFRIDEAAGDIENTLLWRRGGLYRVRLGVESGSRKILDLMNKDIDIEMTKAALSALAYAGIKTTTYWVIGHPGETEEDFQQTLDLVEEMRNDIFQAECNPFLYHYSGQFDSHTWAGKRMSLYPEKFDDMLVFKSWTLDWQPLREEAYRRMHIFVRHCKKLGISNPYSLSEHYKADERWKKLHKNAVPSLVDFINRKNYIDENKDVKKLHFLENARKNSLDFGFEG